MSSTEAENAPPARPRPRALWPWLALVGAMAWVAIVRIPIVLNAPAHLDSDLAVDGLTLAEAVDGHWRWHFPGTPHMGIGPLLLAWPQARLWGADPITLVSGGVVAYELLLLATFLLARMAFGHSAAAWGLIPLAFSSTGAVWLSGRLTGGHLLTAAWSAGAFALLHAGLVRGGIGRALILGLWCGLGLYLDRLFAFTLLAVVPAVALRWPSSHGRSGRGRCLLAFIVAAAVGYLPHEVGRVADPHDAYREQFDPILAPEVIRGHYALLVLDCLPRLIAGHRLPRLQSEPSPAAVGVRPSRASRPSAYALDLATTALALALFAGALIALPIGPPAPDGRAGRAIRWGMLASSAVLVLAFIVNRNIFNSDNYRYLVPLLLPWSLGFGLAVQWVTRWRVGLALASGLLIVFGGLMTLDTARWYARFGWIGEGTRSARPDPALDWLRSHPEITHVFGGYWDVYRLAFLSGRRVEGVPYPIYPNRFPGWSRGLGPGRGRLAVIRPDPRWREFLRASWRDEGRDPAELGKLSIVTWP